MFDKILIANRGEIACRITTTARRMGVTTVAVYSDADVGAKHVMMADEAVRIGPAPVGESYLVGKRIIQAALQTQARAIHPGYGFLSENPEFVEAVEAASLVFIGPPAQAIRAMGLKDAAKTLMAASGVPVVPGYHAMNQDLPFLAKEACRIGYPVLIKARAGGGGKGMRRVDDPVDFHEAFAGASREALASFGDPVCLIEKYISSPRHIEIQLFADAHGHVVHLFERDCSLQRRHQKVIEEAPAPGMPDEVRQAMGQAAIDAAKAIGYEGAGTVEFIADGTDGLRPDSFWFMEMNTRLQVEHPVTEAITGLDLVEWQFRVANGEALAFRQADLAIKGHAFEARIYAEDVPGGFLPATGRLAHFSFPPSTQFTSAAVRVDSGVRTGDEITPFYDPMIAKLIVHGPDRQTALKSLAQALSKVQIAGSVTNIAFLQALARHEGFAQASFDTGLIEREQSSLTIMPSPPVEALALAAVTALGLLDTKVSDDPFDRLTGWRAWGQASAAIRLDDGFASHQLRVTLLGAKRFAVRSNAAETEMEIETGDDSHCWLTVGDHRSLACVFRHQLTVTVFMDGAAFNFTAPDPLAHAHEQETASNVVTAPMPGLVKLVHVTTGAKVQAGQALMVLEAMKMEHTLKAPRTGVVADIRAVSGDQVIAGMILLNLEEDDAG